jgi:hypothetical protein
MKFFTVQREASKHGMLYIAIIRMPSGLNGGYVRTWCDEKHVVVHTSLSSINIPGKHLKFHLNSQHEVIPIACKKYYSRVLSASTSVIRATELILFIP